VSREEILAAIRKCAAKLKRSPSLLELQQMQGLTWNAIRWRFGNLSAALRAAGLAPKGVGYRPTAEELLLDWARLARKRGSLPSQYSYNKHGGHSHHPFRSVFGRWSAVPGWFVRFARRKGIESEWRDVLAMIEKQRGDARYRPDLGPGKRRPDLPVYGPPLLCPGVAHAPVNELGVIYVFGALARRLGFVMLRMQAGFPDCEAMREVGLGHWQRVRIEFEFSSRNFQQHGHRKQDCDLIVCWIHDWPSCPKQLEVLELRKIVRGL
jgi:hypothetical protein